MRSFSVTAARQALSTILEIIDVVEVQRRDLRDALTAAGTWPSCVAALKLVAATTAAQGSRMVTASMTQLVDTAERLTAPGNRAQSLMTCMDRMSAELRIFENCAIVIGIYGILEQFVEALVADIIMSLTSVLRYSQLPPRLREHHVRLSVQLLPQLDLPRFAGSGITQETVLRNLVRCIDDSETYEVNTAAFQIHSANVRARVITEMLAAVGMEQVMKAASRISPLREHLEQRFGTTVERRGNEELFAPLNELAERRNEIAHGVVTTTLGPSECRELALFVRDTCESLWSVCVASLWAPARGQTRLCEATDAGGTIRLVDCVLPDEGNRSTARSDDGRTHWGWLAVRADLEPSGGQHRRCSDRGRGRGGGVWGATRLQGEERACLLPGVREGGGWCSGRSGVEVGVAVGIGWRAAEGRMDEVWSAFG